MAGQKKKKETGYDKYVDWKIFCIPVALFFLILMLPTPGGMKDVGTEFKVGPERVINMLTQHLFNKASTDAEQWQLLTAQIMEQNMQMGALSKNRFLSRDIKWCKGYKIRWTKRIMRPPRHLSKRIFQKKRTGI